MKFPAWYGLLVGLLMIAQWAFSILAGDVPEFQSAPWEIAFHLTAEMSTAVMLLIGGIRALRSMAGSKQILLLGLGMVIYSELISPGYFAQLNQWVFVGMFALLLVGAAIAVIQLLNQKKTG